VPESRAYWGSRTAVRILFLFVVLFAAVTSSGTSLPDSLMQFGVLDREGARGPVAFPHKIHEGVLNPDPSNPHAGAEGNACAGCHHTVTSTTAVGDYLPCSTCHGPDGQAGNPADKDGFELSNREISHRACIGCHRASEAATPGVFKRIPGKCGECHEPTLTPGPVPETLTSIFPISEPSMNQALAVPTATSPAPDAAPMNRWDVNPPMRQQGRWYDPYHQNRLKGDLPWSEGSRFLSFSAESESLGVQRQTTGTWAPGNQGTNLLERGNQWAFRENLLLTFDFASKATAFRPAAWRVSITPAFSFNFLRTQRTGIPFEDLSKGLDRRKVFATVQSAFAEFRLGDTPDVFPFLRSDTGVRGDSPYFDSTSVRLGVQPFVSDFRGFIFNDTNLGARIFGNASANRYQFNLAGFGMLQKDVDSELNTWRSRGQAVLIGNIYRQDTFLPGYTMQFSLHYNHDRGAVYTDQNGFIDRVSPAQLDAVYLGWAGDGHLGRLNLTHAFYQALGRDGHNQIANRPVTINAQMGAVEASVTEDWIRFKAGFMYASGDKNPYDGTGRGFDAIMDMPDFAGGRFSFWNAQPLRLVRTQYNLDSQNSLLPSMRSNKFAGASNFVNPGLILYNAGFEADIKPKVRFVANWNYLMFDHTEPITAVIGVPSISNKIGLDNGFGFRLRPLLNENLTVDTGYSFLFSGEGIRQIYGGTQQAGAVLHAVFLRIRLVY
jgi:hypothetical protein